MKEVQKLTNVTNVLANKRPYDLIEFAGSYLFDKDDIQIEKKLQCVVVSKIVTLT